MYSEATTLSNNSYSPSMVHIPRPRFALVAPIMIADVSAEHRSGRLIRMGNWRRHSHVRLRNPGHIKLALHVTFSTTWYPRLFVNLG